MTQDNELLIWIDLEIIVTGETLVPLLVRGGRREDSHHLPRVDRVEISIRPSAIWP